ncbi:LysR family transcriptional regulator [Nitrospira sp. CMX1]|jgi:LysR family hydrogen peroxide-inducible transcriptional activator
MDRAAGKRVTRTELQYVMAVAQERHFGRAAERAFVTQPALSLVIKKLEDNLGVTIFERRQNREHSMSS